MPLDLTGQPLIDRSDFQQLLEAGTFGRWAEQAISLHTKGYCLVDLGSSDWLEKIDVVVNGLQPRLEAELQLWESGESGPLIYFPGSHRLPYLSARSLGLDRDAVMAEPHPQRFFEPVWQQAVSEHPFDKQEFLPKRGELLIWHANLLHGGKPVQDRSSRRWSQVIHYFFSDCLYTTPLRSFAPNGGGTFLRNPFDISKNTSRYSTADWLDVNPTQSR